MGLPGGSDGKGSACNAGDPGSIPGLGRSPGEGNGSTLQCSCRENPRDGGACGLPSMGSHKVGHDLALEQQTEIPIRGMEEHCSEKSS